MAKRSVERSIENIFDGLFSRAFKSGVKPLQLGRKLLQIVDSERDVDAQGRLVVPNSYLVHLSPADREGFADIENTLVHELTAAVREYIRQEGYHVDGKARVALRTNPDLRRGKFEIDSRNVSADAGNEPETDIPIPAEPEAAEMPVAAPPLSMVVNNSDVPPAVLTLPSGQRIELHEGHYVLGRHLESDIVLNDSNVSRKHAEFVCAAGEVVVRDLGSTNGTKVNGVSVLGDQLLQHGDVINFGTAQVRFEAT
ncbi:MAG: hypothetical protein RIR69_1834 [Actinomycetota bacterium]|jgi:hypothetical protein